MFKLKSFIKDERGQSIIIVAAALIVLLGITALTVDVGYLFFQRRHIQNTADAAALAGARELIDGDDVYKQVEDYVVANGLDKDDIVNKNEIQGLSSSNSDTEVPVSLKVNRGLFFARVIGFKEADVAGRAVAAIGPAPPEGLKPFGVYKEIIDGVSEGDEFELYIQFAPGGSGGGSEAGNWGFVNFDGPGSAVPQLADWLENGYQGPRELKVDEVIWTAPSVNLNSSQYDGLVNEGDEWYIPILEEGTPGSGEVVIKGFAHVTVDSLDGTGAHMELIATYDDTLQEDMVFGGSPYGGPDEFPEVGIKFAGVRLVE